MSNWKKWVFASDVHGSEQDPIANVALFKFLSDFKPDIRIAGGDIFDLAALRRKASEEEKRISIRADYEAGHDWLLKFKPNHFLLGNHDKRLWDVAALKKGPISDYCQQIIDWVEADCKKMKCPIYPWTVREGIVEIGKLKALHGFKTGVGAAQKMAQTYGSCIFGHGHGIQLCSIPGLDERTARMGGCLCRLDMEYSEANIGSLVQRHGWLYGYVNEKNGFYEAFQSQEIGGKFVVLTGMREL